MSAHPRPGHSADRWIPIALFVLGLALLLALRPYHLWSMSEGWVVADEGHQAYQPLRALSGQWYYRDFSTDNYPPGVVLWNALLFKLFGVRISVLRTALAVAGAGIAALAYVLARRISAPWPALLAWALAITWNAPYLNIAFPSWYCAFLGLAALAAVIAFQRRGAHGWLFLAGALIGLSAMFKITQGIYQGVGIALFLAWRGQRARGALPWMRRLLTPEGLFALAGLGAAGFLLRTHLVLPTMIVFALPLLLSTLLVLRGGEGPSEADGSSLWREAGWFVLGAGLVSLAWVLPTTIVLGPELFLEQTFLGPLRRSALMYAPIRPPTLNGWLLLGWAGLGALGLLRARRPARWGVALYALAGAVLLLLPLQGPPTPYAVLRSASRTWGNLRFYLPALVGLGLIYEIRRGRLSNRQREMAGVLLTFGAWNMLQAYPFADSNHLLWSIQPAFIGLAFLIGRAWEHAKVALGRQGMGVAAAGSFALLPILLVGLQIYPIAGLFWDADLNPMRYELLDGDRADIFVAPETGASLRAVAEAIRARTPDGAYIFDTSGPFFYFWTGRHNPTRHDYFWPAFLTEGEVEALLNDLEKKPPALVITRETDEPVFGFASFSRSYPAVADYIRNHYQPEERLGDYTLWTMR